MVEQGQGAPSDHDEAVVFFDRACFAHGRHFADFRAVKFALTPRLASPYGNFTLKTLLKIYQKQTLV
jgi:hypothetical protein